MVHFTLNLSQRRESFETRTTGMNKRGYNALNVIINYKALKSGKLKNQVFAFGHFNEEKIFNNFEQEDNLNEVSWRSDYIIWFQGLQGMMKSQITKFKVETFTSEDI